MSQKVEGKVLTVGNPMPIFTTCQCCSEKKKHLNSITVGNNLVGFKSTILCDRCLLNLYQQVGTRMVKILGGLEGGLEE